MPARCSTRRARPTTCRASRVWLASAGSRSVPRVSPRSTSGADVPAAGEEDLYRHLGLPYVPPELREGSGEVEAAEAGRLPDDLVTAGDLRGLVHCHTVYSDGKHTIAEMARAADAMGMRYLTITDHSPTAFYARGLDVDRLHAQWEEIARVQETVSVRLLRGTESDILADGGLDYPDDILEQLDVVIASIHARHRMDADRMTRRLVRAMQHPCFKIWGHALGRLVLSRPPIECRVEEVLDAAAAARAAIEINGDPSRLDLEPRWIRAARARGLRFVVSTDAHSVDALANQRYGVAMARRGWVRRGEVLNTLDTEAFVRAVVARGSRSEPHLPALAGALRGRARAPPLRRRAPASTSPDACARAPEPTLGEIFSFLSGLYFRGKLAYARAFAAPPPGLPGAPRHHDERWAVPRGRARGPRAPAALRRDRHPSRARRATRRRSCATRDGSPASSRPPTR